MKILDWATLIVGVLGLLLLVIGASLIYMPAGFIVAGAGMLSWSYMVARATSKG